ncbi:MAG: molybdenum cofactor biosynthesis protein B [Actinomycetota bacterium]
MNVAVLTVSDRASSGEYPDEGGPLLQRLVADAGGSVTAHAVVPDDQAAIEKILIEWSSRPDVDVILTTGGTGFGARDVTPEATRAVIDRDAPGIAEAMRAAGLRVTPFAALGRQVAGIKGRTLIVNLPGALKAAAECMDALVPVLPHAVEMLRA